MNIIYTFEKIYNSSQLEKLFLSVGWLSGKYPERLYKALNNSATVITAWEGDNLIGLISAIDDSELTAYVHYLLVSPEHQHLGIGKTLLTYVKDKYKDYLNILLLAENKQLIEYYKKEDFNIKEDAIPMSIQNL